MKDNPHTQRTPETMDRKDLTLSGATFGQGEGAQPELERMWNALQPKLDRIDQELEAEARRKERGGVRRTGKHTLLLVACALLVCGCALAAGIKLWDLKVGVIDGKLGVSAVRNQNDSTLQREVGTGWGDALDQALVERDIRAAMPKWIPEGFVLADIIVDDAREIVDISARYEKGEAMIHFSVTQVQEGGMIEAFYELNEALRAETIGNLEVYFFANNARNGAAWNEDEYLVYFSGDISEQEVEKMVSSIFEDEGGEP